MRRLPFTAAMVTLMLVIGVATGSLWFPAEDRTWFSWVGYGLPSLDQGAWWTPATGAFLALSPVLYLPMVGSFAVLVGFAEWRMGTKRAALITVAGQLVAVLASVLLLAVFRSSGWEWAAQVATRSDVGFSAGALGVFAAVSAGLRSPWRLRARIALILYVLLSFVLVGSFADLAHLLAVVLGIPVGIAVSASRPDRHTGGPSRREWRLLAVGGLVLISVADIVLFLAPANGPLGPTVDTDLTLVDLAVNVVLVGLLANGLRKGRRLSWRIAVAIAGLSSLLGLVLTGLLAYAVVTGLDVDTDSLGMTIAGQVAWAVLLLVLVLGRKAFRAPSRRRLRTILDRQTDRGAATTLLRANGGSTLSWMSTWPDNRYFFSMDRRSVVAYQVHSRVAIGLGDPIGPTDDRDAAISEFTADAERLGLTPAFFSTTRATTDRALAQGYRELQVAEDTLLDLPGLAFTGKSWQDIRTAINRAAKDNITFRMVTLADEPWSLVAQLRGLSEQWIGDKGLPEMGFTLGSVDEALDREVRVALAQDENGTVQGVLSWLPVHSAVGAVNGWTLDLMRRRDGGFRPVIEFLIARSVLTFQAEGALLVSLSGAPLARAPGTDDSDGAALPKVLDSLGALLEPVYGFRSLHAFKAKFRPRYESLHLLYRDEADLPRIGLAIAHAYLPDTSLRDMVAAARLAS